jgi:hypothetical protein
MKKQRIASDAELWGVFILVAFVIFLGFWAFNDYMVDHGCSSMFDRSTLCYDSSMVHLRLRNEQ